MYTGASYSSVNVGLSYDCGAVLGLLTHSATQQTTSFLIYYYSVKTQIYFLISTS